MHFSIATKTRTARPSASLLEEQLAGLAGGCCIVLAVGLREELIAGVALRSCTGLAGECCQETTPDITIPPATQAKQFFDLHTVCIDTKAPCKYGVFLYLLLLLLLLLLLFCDLIKIERLILILVYI